MATYLQGVQDFIPQVQPWSPDFNFFQNAMERKQQAYDQGWRQMNSIYSSLLNSPMMREDTSAKRDALFRSIENDINRLADVDLSLPQNVHASKQIFKPITNDQNIIHDIGYTKNYQSQLQTAEALRNCLDPKECGGMYWDDGVKYLNYKAEEYKNAPAEFALSMSAPRYIPYTDKVDKAYDMLFDKFKEKKLSYSNGKYLIEETNGTHLIVPMASYLARTVGNDPAVQAMYKVKAYNARKDWESQNINNYGSVEEANNYYIQNVIKPANKINETIKNEVSQERSTREGELNAFRKLIMQEGVIPESKEHKDYGNTLNAFQRAIASEKNMDKVLENSYSIDQMTNMRAKEMNADATVAQSMLFNDLLGIATRYQEGTYERQIKGADPYAIKDYEFDIWLKKEFWKKILNPDDVDENGNSKTKKKNGLSPQHNFLLELNRIKPSQNNVFGETISEEKDNLQVKEDRIESIKEGLRNNPKYKNANNETIDALAQTVYDKERNAITYNREQGESLNDQVQSGKINNIITTLNALLAGPKTDENKAIYNAIVENLGFGTQTTGKTEDGKTVVLKRKEGRSVMGKNAYYRTVPSYENAIDENFKFSFNLLKPSKLSLNRRAEKIAEDEYLEMQNDQIPLLGDLYNPTEYYKENIHDNIDKAYDYIMSSIKNPYDEENGQTINSVLKDVKLTQEFQENQLQVFKDEEALESVLEVQRKQMFGTKDNVGFIDQFITRAKTIGKDAMPFKSLLSSIKLIGDGDLGKQMQINTGYETELKNILLSIDPTIDENLMNVIFTHLEDVDDDNKWEYIPSEIPNEAGEFGYPGPDFWTVSPTRIDNAGNEVPVSIQELDEEYDKINNAYADFLGIAAENMFTSSGFDKSKEAWMKDMLKKFPFAGRTVAPTPGQTMEPTSYITESQIGSGMENLLNLIYTGNVPTKTDQTPSFFSMVGPGSLPKIYDEQGIENRGLGLSHQLSKLSNELKTFGSYVGDTGVPSLDVPGQGKILSKIDNSIVDNMSTQLLNSLIVHAISGNQDLDKPSVPITFAEGFTKDVINAMSSDRNSEAFMQYLPGSTSEQGKSSIQALEILREYGDWITEIDDKGEIVKRITPSLRIDPDVDGENFAVQLKLDPDFIEEIKGTKDAPGIGALRDEEGNLILDGDDKVQLTTGLSENGLVFNVKDDTQLGQAMKQQIMTSNLTKAVLFKGYYDDFGKVISPRSGIDLKIIYNEEANSFRWDENSKIKVFDESTGEYLIQNLVNTPHQTALSGIDKNDIDKYISNFYTLMSNLERENNQSMARYKVMNGAVKDYNILEQMLQEMQQQ